MMTLVKRGRRIFVIIFLVVAAFSQDKKLDLIEGSLFTSYVALSGYDFVLTDKVIKQGGVEGNFIYGKSPSTAKLIIYKTAAAGVTYYLTKKLDDRLNRKLVLIGLNCIFLTVVYNNLKYVN